MNRFVAMLAAVFLMLFTAGCMEEKNDNPTFSAQPADTIQGLDYLD